MTSVCLSDGPTGIACWMFSCGYRSRTLPRKGCRSLACPRGSIGSHTSSQRVSFLCMSSQTVRVVCIVRQRYRSLDLLTRVTPPARLFFSWWVGFRLTSRGVLPRTLVYIVCFLWWWTLYVSVVWVTVLWWVYSMWGVHSMWWGMVGCWDWLLVWAWCGSVSFRLTGVARVPRAGGGWLLVGACLVRAFSWYGGSLDCGAWLECLCARTCGMFSGGGWLVGGCGVLKC